MHLGQTYIQVTIDTTASTGAGTAVLSTANTGKLNSVPVLHRLELAATAPGTVRIQSITTASTNELVGTMTLGCGEASTSTGATAPTPHPLSLPFEPTIEGCLRGRRGGNLQITGSVGMQLDGFAIVGWTTHPAT